MKKPKVKYGLLAAVATLSISTAVLAAAPGHLDVPAGKLVSALKSLATQANVELVYQPEQLKDFRTNGVKGAYSPQEAIAILLKGTTLRVYTAASGAMVIAPADEPAKKSTSSPQNIMQLVAADYTVLEEMPSPDDKKASADSKSSSKDKEAVERMIVEGERDRPKPFSDRNVDLPRTINDVQPYYIFDSRTIEESGVSSVEEFLKQRLTMNATVQTNSQVIPTASQPQGGNALVASATSSINLRGLGADRTLILVNGLPMPGVTLFNGSVGSAVARQPDLNGIPLSAIDRIEVLPSSAGAIYGANAEGGVINVVLKKAYNGGDITASYASTWDGYAPNQTVSGTFGKSFNGGKTQLFVSAQYSDLAPIVVGERLEILERGYEKILRNNPLYINGFSRFGNLGFLGSVPNISSAGTTLTLKSTGQSLGSSHTHIPAGTSPATSAADLTAALLQNAGQLNYTPPPTNQIPSGTLLPLGNFPRKKAVLATLTREVTSNLQLHLDFSIAENRSFTNFNSVSIGGGGVRTPYFTVGAGVPNNPFNQTVYVSFPFNLDSAYTTNSRTTSATLGGTLKLARDWVAHLDYQWSESHSDFMRPNYFFDASDGPVFSSAPTFGPRTVAVNGAYVTVNNPNPTPMYSGAINPFVDTLMYPIDWSPFTYTFRQSGKTRLNSVVFAASGPLFSLPWGSPRLGVRLQHDVNTAPAGATNSYAPTATPYPGLPISNWYTYRSYKQSQTNDTVSAQLDLPLFKSRMPFLRALDAQFNFGYQRALVDVGSPGYIVRTDNNYAWYTGPLEGPLAPLDANRQPYRYQTTNSDTSITGPALSYKPFDDLIIRASIADGYVPPTYSQLLPNAVPNTGTTSINDPTTGTTYSVQTYSGGNPNLNPQTSKSWNMGAIWEPRNLLRGLRVNIEYHKTEQRNLIFSPGAQFLVSNESAFSSLVVRNASGLVTTIYNQPVNLNLARNEALDFTVDYVWSSAFGDFGITAAQTSNQHIQQQVSLGGPLVEYVGFPNSGGIAKAKASATLRWNFRNWVTAWTVVNFGGYTQSYAPGDPNYAGNPYGFGTAASPNFSTTYTSVQGGLTIPAQTYHNLFVSYSFGKDSLDRSRAMGRQLGALLNGVKISLGINNVFNTTPPFDAYYQPFFTSPYGDIQLRNYAVSLKKSF